MICPGCGSRSAPRGRLCVLCERDIEATRTRAAESPMLPRATDAYTEFHWGEEARRLDVGTWRPCERPFVYGTFTAIIYVAVKAGERDEYIHAFEGTRPTLAADRDGVFGSTNARGARAPKLPHMIAVELGALTAVQIDGVEWDVADLHAHVVCDAAMDRLSIVTPFGKPQLYVLGGSYHIEDRGIVG